MRNDFGVALINVMSVLIPLSSRGPAGTTILTFGICLTGGIQSTFLTKDSRETLLTMAHPTLLVIITASR